MDAICPEFIMFIFSLLSYLLLFLSGACAWSGKGLVRQPSLADTRASYNFLDDRYIMMIRIHLRLLLLLYLSGLGLVQLVTGQALQITTNNNATTLSESLEGAGVTIQNAIYTGPPNAVGLFENTSEDFPIQRGLVLTTGRATVAAGPNDIENATIDNTVRNIFGFPINTWPNAWATETAENVSRDAAVLAFDVVPGGNRLKFRYVFASEEYREFVYSEFNDIFGLLISGPGIVGRQNLALVPGTNVPVTINTVNNGNDDILSIPSNPEFFIDNTPLDSPLREVTQYDGLTVLLEAEAEVQPCQTYRIELIVSDIGDPTLDSGVFLEAESFTSEENYALQVENALSEVDFAENCGDEQKIVLERTGDIDQPVTISWVVGGTATQGVDYTLGLSSPQLLPAGQAVIEIPVTILSDALVEGTETLEFDLFSSLCGSPILALKDTFRIRDFQPLVVTVPGEVTFCASAPTKTLTATASGAFGNYRFRWTGAPQGADLAITAPGTYTVAVRDSCPVGASSTEVVKTVSVSFVGTDGISSNDTTYTHCTLGAYSLQAPQVLGGGAALCLSVGGGRCLRA